jgi:hypothetical protein
LGGRFIKVRLRNNEFFMHVSCLPSTIINSSYNYTVFISKDDREFERPYGWRRYEDIVIGNDLSINEFYDWFVYWAEQNGILQDA